MLGRRQQLALARPREPERVQQQEAILHGHPYAVRPPHTPHRTAHNVAHGRTTDTYLLQALLAVVLALCADPFVELLHVPFI